MALKKIIGVATSTYVIDAPLEVNSDCSNGQDAHLQGSYLQRCGIYLHSWAVFGAEGVCPSPSDLAQDQQGTLDGGEAARVLPCEWAFPCLPLLAVLPFPPRAARPHICRDTGWTKAGSSSEALKSYKGQWDSVSNVRVSIIVLLTLNTMWLLV